MSLIRLTAILTVHNRKEKTIAALESLFSQIEIGESFAITVVLVDDGSSDGTSQAIETLFGPRVHVLSGDGSLFWARGMNLAERTAIVDRPDAVLWINDDIVLDDDAVARAVALYERSDHRTIIVGAMRSSTDGSTTYGGSRLRTSRPGSMVAVRPSTASIPIDTFNGNFVLVPKSVYSSVAAIRTVFSHAYGDIDYGLRARSAGFGALLAPGQFGVCDFNPKTGTWQDQSLPRLQRIKTLFGRKGYPVRSHLAFNRAHGGALWPIYFAGTYVKSLGKIAIGR